MSGFMVRLQDGSEIGPLDLAMVRSWYEQGLIDAGSLVLRQGSRRWTKLSEAVNLKGWVSGGEISIRKRARSAPSRRRAPREESARVVGASSPLGRPLNVRSIIAAVVLLVVAGLSGFWAFFPTRQIPTLNEVPWLNIALACIGMALALAPGWVITRKIVRMALLLAFIAAFPLAGILWAAKLPIAALLILGCAAVLAMGLVSLLTPEAISLWRLLASLVVVVVGLTGIVWLGFAAEGEHERKVQQWISEENKFEQQDLGLRVVPPRNWAILRQEQAAVEVPDGALVVLARRDGRGFAFLTSETRKAPQPLEAALDHAFLSRRVKRPALKEQERSDVEIGKLRGRRLLATWTENDEINSEVTVVWRNGLTYFTLVAWSIELRPPDAVRDLAGVLDGVSCGGTASARLRKAVERAAKEVPYLSAEAAEIFMSMSEAEVLEPDELFRRSQTASAAGFASLSKEELREFRALSDRMYANMSRRDKTRLGAYIEKLRRGDLTSAKENEDMRALMKQALLRLRAEELQRFQALFDKAIFASLSRS